ncbi:hypothetical protein PSU4_09740 [Pseudonocardia sulfidoxydans NBRC 16205]|uniref:DUF306 domain-containing protein n=1 Tax=Pseudonocardia sulfidoxydans NBRC 16205 TaxID=1223511 RepID=A0A511DB26_9PSEU|nr:hypothetical protein PSU4_09740 [Pseudonocardia sulfidoxydans NBRC 16205]
MIVELALNGPTPRSVNRHVPRTPAEITAVALEGIELGASIVHNHTDDVMFSVDGVHAVEPYVQAWTPILDRHPDVLLYPTMGAAARGIPVERRWAHVEELARRGMGMTLVDPGSVNLGLTSDGALDPVAAAEPYANPHADVDHMITRTAALGAAPSISIFEPGYLRTALTWHRTGRLPAGAIVKLYFGGRLEFGLPPTATALEAYLEMLEPTGLPWSVAVLGGDVVGCGLAELAVRRGGHVRVGLEDHAGPGEPSNADLLRALMDLLRDMGRSPATIAEARAILGVPSGTPGLWGRTFVGDAPPSLGDGTPVTVTFVAPDGIAVHAGGNRLGFRATASADRLTVDDRVRATRMACPPDVQALDDWLVALLTADPAYVVDGQSLTLVTDAARIDLVESPERH